MSSENAKSVSLSSLLLYLLLFNSLSLLSLSLLSLSSLSLLCLSCCCLCCRFCSFSLSLLCVFYGPSHLFPNEVDLKSNVTEEEDEERDGDPNQVDDCTRGKAHRVLTAGHLVFSLLYFSVPISILTTSQMPITESQPNPPKLKLPAENSKTAGLMTRKERSQMKKQLVMIAYGGEFDRDI